MYGSIRHTAHVAVITW